MNVIREQTTQIEKTDQMIQSSLSDIHKAAVKALCDIPGIAKISADM